MLFFVFAVSSFRTLWVLSFSYWVWSFSFCFCSMSSRTKAVFELTYCLRSPAYWVLTCLPHSVLWHRQVSYARVEHGYITGLNVCELKMSWAYKTQQKCCWIFIFFTVWMQFSSWIRKTASKFWTKLAVYWLQECKMDALFSTIINKSCLHKSCFVCYFTFCWTGANLANDVGFCVVFVCPHWNTNNTNFIFIQQYSLSVQLLFKKKCCQALLSFYLSFLTRANGYFGFALPQTEKKTPAVILKRASE